MKNSQTNIRKLARKYRAWLTNQPRLLSDIADAKECLSYLDDIISRKADTAVLLWDAIVDHLHETPWDADDLPAPLAELYDMIDEYRNDRNVDSTDYATLLAGELVKHENQTEYPQVVFSQLFEKMTGNTLTRDTDPKNGEDYLYRSSDQEPIASTALHPAVVDYFGLTSEYLVLFSQHISNTELARALSTHQRELFY